MPRDPVDSARRAAGVVAVVYLLGVTATLLYLVGRPLATDDLWWHLKLGEVYAQEGPWLAEDPLFHTVRDRPTVPHEWLFQVAVHHLQGAVGFQGLRAAHVLAVAAILLWSLRIFRRGGASLAAAALATATFAVLSWFRLFQFRPELASLAALLGVYVLLLESEEPPSWSRVAAAVALCIAWANVHSLFAIAPALLLAALLGIGLRRLLLLATDDPAAGAPEDAALARRLGIALTLVLLLTAANPRGFEQHATFFVESASGDIWLLGDDFLRWNPLWPTAENRALTPLCWLLADLCLLGVVLVTGAGLARFLRERSATAARNLDTVHLGLAAAGLVSMLVAARFHWMSFFPLLFLLRAGRRLDAGRAAWGRTLAWAPALATLALAAAFPSGIRLGSYVAEVAAEPDGYWRSPYLDQRYCGAGMRFLRDAKLEGRMFHPFNLGGFLGYWLAPGLRTFIDGRMDHYPGKVLKDYLRIRSASRQGGARLLQRTLEEWEVDVFFGTAFPESRYAGRYWIASLRRLPGWIPVFTSQTHSIYLRRTKRNRKNLERVAAYYLERRLPFSPDTGFDAGRAIRQRPGWAHKMGLVPPSFGELEKSRNSQDPRVRTAALDRLGHVFWQVGAFREQVDIDRELVSLVPRAKEPRRRLADGLLNLGRDAEALAVARALLDEDPDYEDVFVIHRMAEKRAGAGHAPEGS